jgi:ABC-type cobalamin/Fe3+-siderophores transport system ATPase subunit
MWTLDSIELNGGFLPGLKLPLPRGLICIIGPRGSGKSTLAEALRSTQERTT